MNILKTLTVGILWVVRIQWDAEILKSVAKKIPIQRLLLMEIMRLLVMVMLCGLPKKTSRLQAMGLKRLLGKTIWWVLAKKIYKYQVKIDWNCDFQLDGMKYIQTKMKVKVKKEVMKKSVRFHVAQAMKT